MDFLLNEAQLAIEKECQNFADSEITPYITALENELIKRRNLFRKMAKAGLLTLAIPRNQGGSGIDSIAYVSGLKAIAKADAGIAVGMAVSNMVAEAIFQFGTQTQKEAYLPDIINGNRVPLSFAITEPQAGSDVKAIETVVFQDSDSKDCLLLSGQKQFITNANLAETILVIAKTEETETSAFLIDGGIQGMEILKKEQKLGLLTVDLVDIGFDCCIIPQSSLLGNRGEGLKIALSCLDSGRIGIAAQAVGIAEAAFESALEYSQKRIQFGRPIFDNQIIAFKLADMHTQIEAAKGMLYRAAWLKDKGDPYTIQAAEAKLFCSEMCNKVADEALQIHGGYGYVKGYNAEKYFRDARATTIYEGTSEIQRLVIARSLYR